MQLDRNRLRQNKNTDIAFFIYFTMMALFFTKTYIQLAAQLAILVYVVYDNFSGRKYLQKSASMKNVRFLIAWFGIFVLWAFLSKSWAYGIREDTNTLLTLFRILVIGIALFYYVSTYEKAVGVIKAFIYSTLIMAVTVMLTTPLSQYGKAGEDGFGDVIGQQRNAFGAVMTFVIPLCIVLYQYEGFRRGRKLAVFFAFALLCSGSRGAMLQLVIILGLYVVTLPGIIKKFKYMFGAVIIAIIAVIALQNIPYLYETVWVRFINMFATVTGIEETADSSALTRELYKVLAWDMFAEKPILGFGIDGFFCYLRDIEYVNGYYVPPRYSHCNFTEIAANFGLVGLAIWYIPMFSIIVDSFKLRYKTPCMNMVFITLTSMVILDYARIPWANHLSMYTYFCVILIYLCTKHSLTAKRHQSEFGVL